MAKPVIWNYFERNAGDKIADCMLCDKKLSYRSTSTNLKQHLKIKHDSAYEEFLKLNSSMGRPRINTNTKHKPRNLPIWNYFDPNLDKGHKFADCRLCKKTLSYKTTITNLKYHLKQQHANSYNEMLEQVESVKVNSSEEDSTTYESGKYDLNHIFNLAA